MNEKKITSRIVHKHDTEANWNKATNFIPLKGELIVYDIDSAHSYERIKIGDGVTKVSALPFADDTKVDKISGKGLSTNDYTTAEKDKLAGIATGANKTTVDSTLSTSSTNPVQNKVVTTAINNLNTLVGDTSVSSQISSAIANKVDKVSGKGLSTNDLTAALKSNYDAAYAHSTAAHAPSNAEVNQNAFSNVVVGSTTIAADSKTDSLTLAGSNVTLTPDATNDKVTIGITKANVTAALGYTPPTTDTTYSAAGSSLGLVKSGGDVTISSGVITVNDDSHNHVISNIDGLQSALDGKSATGHTHDDRYYTETEIDAKFSDMVGDSSVSAQISSAIANKVDKVSGKSLSTNDYTTTEKNKLSGIASGAEVNQNAFSNIKVGDTTVSADSKTDTLTFVAGSNVTITPDATNDKITIAAKDTVYTHPNSGVTAGTYKSVTVNAQGHVTGGSNPTTLSGYGITDAATKTELNSVSSLVGDTAVSTQISDAVSKKADLANGQYAVTASSSDGVTYTATVSGITALTSGVSFIMIPGRVSASTAPTLNVNGLGAKYIKRRLSNLATGTQAGYTTTWLAANLPFRVTYDGTQWIVEGQDKPVGADVYGAVAKATADGNGNVIADTYATIAALQALLPKVTSITLGTTWSGTASPYYQDVALSCCTATSMVDLQPTPEQLISWQNNGYSFTTYSGAGSVRVYVVGGVPTEAITVQVKVQEVVIV